MGRLRGRVRRIFDQIISYGYISDPRTIESKSRVIVGGQGNELAGRRPTSSLRNEAGAQLEGGAGPRARADMLASRPRRTARDVDTKPDTPLHARPKSLFMQRWDNFIMVLLLFVAFVTPFGAFLPTKPDALFAINESSISGSSSTCAFSSSFRTSIAMSCRWSDLVALHAWVIPIDVISVLPYDFFGGDPFLEIDMPEVDTESSGNLRTLRLVRLLRLIKLVRVVKARIFYGAANKVRDDLHQYLLDQARCHVFSPAALVLLPVGYGAWIYRRYQLDHWG